jgi:hypothetical protein
MTEPVAKTTVDLGSNLRDLRTHRLEFDVWTKGLRSADVGDHEIEVGNVLYRFHKSRTQRTKPSAAVAAVMPGSVPSQPQASATDSSRKQAWATFSTHAVRSALLVHVVGDRRGREAAARLEAALLVLAPGTTPVAAPKRLDAGVNSRICNSLLRLLWESVKGIPPPRNAGWGTEEMERRVAARAAYDRKFDVLKDALTADATAVCLLPCVQSLMAKLGSPSGASQADVAATSIDTTTPLVTETETVANTAMLAYSLASSPDSHLEAVRAVLLRQS